MEIRRTFDLLERYRTQFPDKEEALCGKQNGEWVKYGAAAYHALSHHFAMGLMEMGFRKGDKIMSVSNNRPEWNFADMGMAMAGVVHVPVFTSLSTAEYAYILRHCEARMLLVSDRRLLRLVEPACAAAGAEIPVYTFDVVEGAKNWKEIAEAGESAAARQGEALEALKESIREEDPVSLIYTSGTTGTAKGVILTHRNLVSNFLSAASVFKLAPEDRYLGILPLCHVGGRMGNFQTQYSGASIYYAENMGTIAANMADIRPDGFDAVPRVLEKFFGVILSKGNKLTGVKKKLFFWAVELGLRYRPFGENGWWYGLQHALADRLVFVKWRQALGGRVRIAGCGGASLPARLERVFWAAGIKIINMYGLTETSPVITINRTEKGRVKLGSVGTVIEGVEVKIAPDGEILCKGPNVTPGYYKDPERTREAFDEEGWFRTGDIGYFEEGGFLMVTDRKKEIFKLSNGKFIAPQIIENILRESVYIDQALVTGEHEKFASALLSPDFRNLEAWMQARGLPVGTAEENIGQPEVLALFGNEVDALNRKLSPPERLSRFRLVPDEWSPATGELSPTLKLKRQFIHEKYNELLAQIYRKG